MAAEGRVGRVREPLDEGAFPMTIEINGMAHVILTMRRLSIGLHAGRPMLEWSEAAWYLVCCAGVDHCQIQHGGVVPGDR